MFMKCPANESRVPIPMGKSGKWSESDLKVIWKWSVSFTIQHHPTSTFIIQWFNINIQTFETRPSQQNSHPTAYEAWNTDRHPSEWIGGARGTRYTLGHPGVLASETWRNRAGKKKTNFWGNMKYLCGKSVIKTEVIDMWYQLITCDIKVCPVLFPLAHGPSRSRHHRSRQGKARNHHDHPKMEKGHREPWSGATVRESPKFQKLSSAPSEFTTSMVWNSKMAPFSVENPSSIISVPQFSQGADEKVPGSHLPPRRPKRCGFYHETMGWDQFLKL